MTEHPEQRPAADSQPLFGRMNGVWHDGSGKPVPTAPMGTSLEKGIPLVIAEEAYKEYVAQFGACQTLQRLNERGGFGASELANLLYARIKRLEAQHGR